MFVTVPILAASLLPAPYPLHSSVALARPNSARGPAVAGLLQPCCLTPATCRWRCLGIASSVKQHYSRLRSCWWELYQHKSQENKLASLATAACGSLTSPPQYNKRIIASKGVVRGMAAVGAL